MLTVAGVDTSLSGPADAFVRY